MHLFIRSDSAGASYIEIDGRRVEGISKIRLDVLSTGTRAVIEVNPDTVEIMGDSLAVVLNADQVKRLRKARGVLDAFREFDHVTAIDDILPAEDLVG